MRFFLYSSEKINSKLKKLQSYIAETKRFMLIKQNSVMNHKEETALEHKIDIVNRLFTKVSGEIKEMIETNQKKTKELKKDKNSSKKLIEIRELHTYRHGRDLADALTHYQNIQCEFKDKERERLRDVYMVSNPSVTEEELEKLNRGGEEAETMIAASFALGSNSAQGLLNEAKTRNTKIKKITELITTLVNLIDEIEEKINDNDSFVDDIVLNIAVADEQTGEANRQLKKTLSYEKSVMRLKRILFVISMIVVGCFVIWGLSKIGFFKLLFK